MLNNRFQYAQISSGSSKRGAGDQDDFLMGNVLNHTVAGCRDFLFRDGCFTQRISLIEYLVVDHRLDPGMASRCGTRHSHDYFD